MNNINITPHAIENLEKIRDYYRNFDPEYFTILKDKIISELELLVNFPKMGKIVSEDESGLSREIYVEKFRIIYDLFDENINVISIIHFKQDHSKFIEK